MKPSQRVVVINRFFKLIEDVAAPDNPLLCLGIPQSCQPYQQDINMDNEIV
jgi:hypothetical protein